MIRKLITFGLPFLAPFVVYYVWWWSVQRRKLAEAQGRQLPAWQELPWAWLITAGSALLAVTLVLTATIGADSSRGTYHPPHFENGVAVPGRIER